MEFFEFPRMCDHFKGGCGPFRRTMSTWCGRFLFDAEQRLFAPNRYSAAGTTRLGPRQRVAPPSISDAASSNAPTPAVAVRPVVGHYPRPYEYFASYSMRLEIWFAEAAFSPKRCMLIWRGNTPHLNMLCLQRNAGLLIASPTAACRGRTCPSPQTSHTLV